VCAPTPISGCANPGKSKLALKGGAKPKLKWKWLAGTVDVADFGAPPMTNGYALCVYADTQLVLTAPVAAGGTCGTAACWKTVGSKGFLYKNKSGSGSAGITKIKLGAGTGTAKIMVFGKGAELVLPLPVAEGSVVTVQLVRSPAGPACWEAVFAPPAGSNAAEKFSDALP
jgi:hypothetical protein